MHFAPIIAAAVLVYAVYVQAAWIFFLTGIVPILNSSFLSWLFPYTSDAMYVHDKWVTVKDISIMEGLWGLVHNLGLVSLLVIQHSIQARPVFKEWLTKFIPAYAERSLFVLTSSILEHVIVAFFAPIPLIIWKITRGSSIHTLVVATQCAAVLLMLYSTFNMSFLDLMGFSQCCQRKSGVEMKHAAHQMPLDTKGLFSYVRHPMYSALLCTLWCTPTITVGHALLASSLSTYIVAATFLLEERDLRCAFHQYRKYETLVPPFLPTRLTPPPQLRELAKDA